MTLLGLALTLLFAAQPAHVRNPGIVRMQGHADAQAVRRACRLQDGERDRYREQQHSGQSRFGCCSHHDDAPSLKRTIMG